MPITVACPGCAAQLRAPEAAAGGKSKCPKCGGVVSVPAAEEVADVASQATRTAPPPRPPSSPGPRQAENENEDRASAARRRRRAEEEDEDDLRRRKSRRRRNHASTQEGDGLQ